MTFSAVAKDHHGISPVKCLGISRPTFELSRIETQLTFFKSIGENSVSAFMRMDGGILTLVGEKDDFLILSMNKGGKGPYGQRGKGENTS